VSSPNPDMSDVNDRTWEKSAVFSGVNRNKRSLVLDMKHDRGREVFARLVAASDVVVESFSPGVVERWGCGGLCGVRRRCFGISHGVACPLSARGRW